ncbi:Protein CBG26346 [Caenorhabditis briggsae]|uniref:Protein CBG26346 n=1 Tax=Caenorhabditis briggsae TaxID=6238 RepID=B6IGB7_CAEBR|nr:Protein CBG26346 [Caenorhabditis briggsae]CAR98947.1 Protein CBG26346 [Caenorhabditis briggsae]
MNRCPSLQIISLIVSPFPKSTSFNLYEFRFPIVFPFSFPSIPTRPSLINCR